MGYLSEDALKQMGFAHLGKNVKISDKAAIYDADRIQIGDHSRIDDFTTLSGHVVIGRNVHVAALCHLAGGQLGVFLDDFSGFAYGVKMMSQSDDYSGGSLTNPTVPADYKTETFSKSRVGRHVIVGTNSVIFPGVDVADGCSVGAMSLVTKSTDPWGVYAGTPARRLKDRSKDLLELERAYLAAEAAA